MLPVVPNTGVKVYLLALQQIMESADIMPADKIRTQRGFVLD
jgi:hypothetical protein